MARRFLSWATTEPLRPQENIDCSWMKMMRSQNLITRTLLIMRKRIHTVRRKSTTMTVRTVTIMAMPLTLRRTLTSSPTRCLTC